MNGNPKVSIIITAYNRAYLIKRAIDSVINQTFRDLEIIIVDDCSTDNTYDLILEYADKRIRYIKHEINKGVCAAKNTGLSHINGEWFTFLDSDDEMIPNAIETMLAVPENIDIEVTAVTCNCLDTITNQFSGKGPDRNGYLNNSTILSRCSGEFWGITKTSLLQKDRFNENLPGFEVMLWHKINNRAKRYYIHQALRIYHTEHSDSVIKTNSNRLEVQQKIFRELIREKFYLNSLKSYALDRFRSYCLKGYLILFVMKDPLKNEYKKQLFDYQYDMKYRLAVFAAEFLGPDIVRWIVRKHYKNKL